MNKDLQHLKWLSIGYYVMSGLFIFFALFSLVFLFFGILFLTTDILQQSGNPEIASYVFGTLNIAISIIFITVGAILSYLSIRTAKNLKRQKHYQFCIIVAIVIFLFQPFGMILGILTFLVLMRDSVKKLFEQNVS